MSKAKKSRNTSSKVDKPKKRERTWTDPPNNASPSPVFPLRLSSDERNLCEQARAMFPDAFPSLGAFMRTAAVGQAHALVAAGPRKSKKLVEAMAAAMAVGIEGERKDRGAA